MAYNFYLSANCLSIARSIVYLIYVSNHSHLTNHLFIAYHEEYKVSMVFLRNNLINISGGKFLHAWALHINVWWRTISVWVPIVCSLPRAVYILSMSQVIHILPFISLLPIMKWARYLWYFQEVIWLISVVQNSCTTWDLRISIWWHTISVWMAIICSSQASIVYPYLCLKLSSAYQLANYYL